MESARRSCDGNGGHGHLAKWSSPSVALVCVCVTRPNAILMRNDDHWILQLQQADGRRQSGNSSKQTVSVLRQQQGSTSRIERLSSVLLLLVAQKAQVKAKERRPVCLCLKSHLPHGDLPSCVQNTSAFAIIRIGWLRQNSTHWPN